MKLREYQNTVQQGIFDAWAKGAQNVLYRIPTGGGKTAIFCDTIAKLSRPTVVIAHRVEIVSQISLTLGRYGIRHNIIAQKSTIQKIIAIHVQRLGKSYYDIHAECHVAGVDTLIRLPENTAWFAKIEYVVQDEAHHVLRKNKWGKAAELFPSARGLYPTATPERADGHGLSRETDGIIDAAIDGPSMKELISQGFLSNFQLAVPPNTLDFSQVKIAANGDYNQHQLREVTRRASITGDIVGEYLKHARGKLGITFAVDIEAATDIAQEYRKNGVSAEVISSKTPDFLRSTLMMRFENREILQLVNVDILGEGVDVPAVEVITMARRTLSYPLYVQQFGRALRPLPGKVNALIIDHVGNIALHGRPTTPRTLYLGRREKKSRSTPDDVIPIRTCLNCYDDYEAIYRKCPYCGHFTPPALRSSPDQVDGDLVLLDPEVFDEILKDIHRVEGEAKIPQHLGELVQWGVANRHFERKELQSTLNDAIALFAGYQKSQSYDDTMTHRLFYFQFGVDIFSARTLDTSKTKKLLKDIIDYCVNKGLSFDAVPKLRGFKDEPR